MVGDILDFYTARFGIHTDWSVEIMNNNEIYLAGFISFEPLLFTGEL